MAMIMFMAIKKGAEKQKKHLSNALIIRLSNSYEKKQINLIQLIL